MAHTLVRVPAWRTFPPRCFYPTTALPPTQTASRGMHAQRCHCCLQLRLLTDMLSCVKLASAHKHDKLLRGSQQRTYLSLGCRAAMEMLLMPHTDRGSCCCHRPAPRRRPASHPQAVRLGLCQQQQIHTPDPPPLRTTPTCQGSSSPAAAAAEGAHPDIQAACRAQGGGLLGCGPGCPKQGQYALASHTAKISRKRVFERIRMACRTLPKLFGPKCWKHYNTPTASK